MTGTHAPEYLVDGCDGEIEEQVWISVAHRADAQGALGYAKEELGDYLWDGLKFTLPTEQIYMRAMDEDEEEQRWEFCEHTDEGAHAFWRIELGEESDA